MLVCGQFSSLVNLIFGLLFITTGGGRDLDWLEKVLGITGLSIDSTYWPWKTNCGWMSTGLTDDFK